jgi:hypothetical protein
VGTYSVAFRSLLNRFFLSCLVALALVTCGGSSTAFAGSSPSVSLRFSHSSPEVGKPVTARICLKNAPPGSVAYFEEQMGTEHVWRSIKGSLKMSGTQCDSAKVVSTVQGEYVYEVRLLRGGRLIAGSPQERLFVYGHVQFTAFCSQMQGCHLVNGSGGPIQVNGHLDEYVDWVCSSTGHGYCSGLNANWFPATQTLNHDSSCRTLTMQVVAIAGDNGATGGQISVLVTQHTLNQQMVTIDTPEVVTLRNFQLDGGPIQIQFGDTGPLSLYILKEWADCYTVSGTL